MDLDGGVAIRIESPGLDAIRDDLAAEFRGLLTSQDAGPWTPHVTIQNKVGTREARHFAAAADFGAAFAKAFAHHAAGKAFQPLA